ncbi:MAG: hypothetical protein JJ878_20555 [Alphaproteobacteria bacterium]|jgi:hypothetical protein|uniref:DUF6916 family protein n=1 Tax=Pacificispira sp. TaxID=2888761 RepID=UPI001B07DF0B|nr:hypothetical protein [Alphaproteobacteria bacterium]MBO6865023.1 hypothetical protein [Alphaproteobacteria bacterium]MEC9268268.1 hypothetical protein [Pseudomonadota bacterium]
MADNELEMGAVQAHTFEPHVGETFRVFNDDGEVEARLVQVRISSGPIPGLRERSAFAAIFMTDHVPPTGDSICVNLENENFGLLKGVMITPNSGIPEPEWGDGQRWSVIFA